MPSEIPLKDTWVPMLFRGHHLRHQFFKDKSLLLVQLNQLPNIQTLPIDLERPLAIQAVLIELQSKCFQASQAISELQIPGFNKLFIFQGRTKRFFESWQQHLRLYRLRLIENKLQLANNIAEALLVVNPLSLPWAMCNILQNLFHEIDNDLKDVTENKSSALKQSLFTIKDKTRSLLSAHRAVNIMQQLAEGKNVAQGDIDYLIDFHHNTQLCNKQLAAEFIQFTEPHCTRMLQQLKSALKQDPLSSYSHSRPRARHCEERSDVAIQSIHQFATVLSQMGNTQHQTGLKDLLTHKLKDYFLRYLMAILQGPSNPEAREGLSKQLVQIESIFIALGIHAKLGGQTLREHALTLQNYRTSKSNFLFFQARAGALANVLADELFIKRIDKDTHHLEQQVFAAIELDPKLNYNINAIEVLKTIQNKMLIANVSDMKDLAELSSYQRTLVGLAEGSSLASRALPTLLSLTVQAKQYQEKSRAKAPLIQKIKEAKHLAQSLEKGLSSSSSLLELNPSVIRSCSKKRLLFSKQDIDPKLLPIASTIKPQ